MKDGSIKQNFNYKNNYYVQNTKDIVDITGLLLSKAGLLNSTFVL